MVEKRSEFEKRIRMEAAKMREESRQERIRRTAAITRAWKEGFAKLKAENDQMQKELGEWWELDRLQIQNYVIENLERGPQ